jgi:5-oxoprolinase (ATP-hydrolysing) subunit C
VSLRVREPGLFSLLVDLGRPHCRHLGVPLGGAADRGALALGNALVGNSPNAVALEVTLAGPTLEAVHRIACVVFGAPFQSTIGGREPSLGTSFTLEPGDVLRVGGTAHKARGYLCVAGGFDAVEVLGSRSALEPIRAGDELASRASRTESRGLPFAWRAAGFTPAVCEDDRDKPGRSPTLLRVLPGPQSDWFNDDSFFAREYEVAPASNRMGLRLNGAPLARQPGELASEAVAPGAVQITNDGMPVVLGVDGQTIGGYPKIAHVIRADLDLLAQLRPGDGVRFVQVTPEEADAAAKERTAFLRTWLTRLRVAERQPMFE